MRVRRAATCVRAARQAIAEGRVIDAEERLDEACRLDPNAAEARLLLEELQVSHPADAAEIGAARLEPRGSRAWSHWAAAAAAIAVLAALAFFWPPDERQHRDSPARTEPTTPVVELPAAVSLDPAAPALDRANPAPDPGTSANRPSVAPTAPRPVATSGNDQTPMGRATPATMLSRPAEVVDMTATAASTPDPIGPPTADPTALTPSPAAPAPAPSAPRSDLAAKPPVSAEVSTPLVSIAEPPVVRAGSSVIPTEPPLARVDLAGQPDATPASLRSHVPADEDLIRATLGRYADAYGRLDVEAARQVWPTVDAEALRRAFGALESQGIAFDQCDLRVAGGDATAACRGRASFVPKVGRRDPLTISRLWVFTLRKGDSGWAITSADAR